MAKASGQHRDYQANTVRNRDVLSVIYVGLRIAFDERFSMEEKDIILAAQQLWRTIESHAIDW